MIGLFLFSIKNPLGGSLKFPDRMQIEVNNFFGKKMRN